MNKKVITSSRNSTFLFLKKIFRQGGYDKKGSLSLVEGDKLCRDLWQQKREVIEKVIVTPGYFSKNKSYQWIKSVPEDKFIFLEERLLKQISSFKTPQGIIFLVKTTLFYSDFPVGNKVLCCYRIQDPLNLGVILRTAEIFGWQDIVLYESVKPFSAKVLRTSQGATFLLNFIEISSDIVSFLEYLQQEKGYNLITATVNGENELKEVEDIPKKILVLGSEGQGVAKEVEKLSNIKVYVEQVGKIESLNVSVAAGILCYYFK